MMPELDMDTYTYRRKREQERSTPEYLIQNSYRVNPPSYAGWVYSGDPSIGSVWSTTGARPSGDNHIWTAGASEKDASMGYAQPMNKKQPAVATSRGTSARSSSNISRSVGSSILRNALSSLRGDLDGGESEILPMTNYKVDEKRHYGGALSAPKLVDTLLPGYSRADEWKLTEDRGPGFKTVQYGNGRTETIVADTRPRFVDYEYQDWSPKEAKPNYEYWKQRKVFSDGSTSPWELHGEYRRKDDTKVKAIGTSGYATASTTNSKATGSKMLRTVLSSLRADEDGGKTQTVTNEPSVLRHAGPVNPRPTFEWNIPNGGSYIGDGAGNPYSQDQFNLAMGHRDGTGGPGTSSASGAETHSRGFEVIHDKNGNALHAQDALRGEAQIQANRALMQKAKESIRIEERPFTDPPQFVKPLVTSSQADIDGGSSVEPRTVNLPWDYHEDPVAWLNHRAAEMYRREEA